jgi:hypothetical protein
LPKQVSTNTEHIKPLIREKVEGMANKTNDPGSQGVESGTSRDPNAAEEMRRARRDQSPDPTPEDKRDFDVTPNDEAVWVKNRNGGVHDVPANWVTEDEVGVVRIRGNLGYRYANDKEISEARQAQGLKGSGSARSTEGTHSANAEEFEVTDEKPQGAQTAPMGHASTTTRAQDTKGS